MLDYSRIKSSLTESSRKRSIREESSRKNTPLGGDNMPATLTKKIAPEIDAQLWEEVIAVAEQNGQSQRYVLEQALTYYLRNVVPSQHLVRPEVMKAFEESVARNHKLYELLAK